jgi:predicted GH43/DUF377 family glycosyl hydrolase
MLEVRRTQLLLKPNSTRVLFRPFEAVESRAVRILARISSLTSAEVDHQLQQVLAEFHGRHHRLTAFLLERFAQVERHLVTDRPLEENRRLLIGAYFTHEYALQSAALFNPSMVWHPDQSDLPPGSSRFVLSLRATGEGHISSITFRSGVVDCDNRISLDPDQRFATVPRVEPDGAYDKSLFRQSLIELGVHGPFSEHVLDLVGESFTMGNLISAIRTTEREYRYRPREENSATAIRALAESNYEITYDAQHHISERILFPHSPAEMRGMEDARFVRFVEEDGTVRYFATYTAFDGQVILPQLLATTDFLRFKISTLNGPEVKSKGMALFPRRINGSYAMLSRQDNENIFIMFSDHLHFWYTKELLLKPSYPWEFVQIGNCGSPVETEAGWVVLSHGVGPMRKYSIGAFLLDKNDPMRVIGRLSEPLLAPDDNEREGYVPNVVYSCGALIHGKDLIIPYAMSDYASTFALVDLAQLLEELTRRK